jgi:hypothetical protein
MLLHEVAEMQCGTDWTAQLYLKNETGVATGHVVGDPLTSGDCATKVNDDMMTWRDADLDKIYLVEPSVGNALCIECPDGAVARPGSSECEVCAAGKKASADGESCEACPIGRESERGATVCDACILGMFAPEDPLKPGTGEGTGQCSPCEAGKYAPTAEWSAECLECKAGQYSNKQEGSDKCLNCPLGKFSAADLASECESCAVGHYQSAEAQTVCAVCEVGKYGETSGLPQCSPCGLGKYKEVTAAYLCDECNPGKFASTTGQVLCTDCTIGYFQKGYAGEMCERCEDRHSSNAAHIGDCFECPAGEVTSDAAPACTACPAGKYQDANQCVQCPAGKFQDAVGQVQCQDCLAGHISPTSGGLYTMCELCAKGKVQPDAGQGHCTECDAGTYSMDNGEVCANCPAGKFDEIKEYEQTQTDPDRSYCKDCIRGKYSTGGSIGCTFCEVGKYAELTGTGNQCTACAMGQYQDTQGESTCKDCEVGKVATGVETVNCVDCEAGKFQEPDAQSCTMCVEGEQQPDAGKAECIQCAPGKAPEAAVLKTTCNDCLVGQYADLAGLGSCKTCPIGTYSSVAGIEPIAGMMDCYDVSTASVSGEGWTSVGVATDLDAAKALCDGYEFMTLDCPTVPTSGANNGTLQVNVKCGMLIMAPSQRLPMAECAGWNDASGTGDASHLGTNADGGCTGPFFFSTGKPAILGGYQRGAVYPLADIVYGENRGSTECPTGYQQITDTTKCADAAAALGVAYQHTTNSPPSAHPKAIPNCFMGPSSLVEGDDYDSMGVKNLKVYFNTGGSTVTNPQFGEGWPMCKRPDPADFDNTEQVASWEPTGGTTPITMATATTGNLDWDAYGTSTVAAMPLVTYATADHTVHTDIPLATIDSVESKQVGTDSNTYLLRTDFNKDTVDTYDGNSNVGTILSSAFKLGVGEMTFEASGTGGEISVCKADAPGDCVTSIRPGVEQVKEVPYTCAAVESWTPFPTANQNQETHPIPFGGFGTCNDQGWSKKGDAYKAGTTNGCYNGGFHDSELASANGGSPYTCKSAGAWQTYSQLPGSGDNTASGEGWSRRGPPSGKSYIEGTGAACAASGFWGTYAAECPASHPTKFMNKKGCCHTTPTTKKVWGLYTENGGKGFCGPQSLNIAHTESPKTGFACKTLCENTQDCTHASFSECDVTVRGITSKDAAKAIACQPCAANWKMDQLVLLGAAIQEIPGLATDDSAIPAGQNLEACNDEADCGLKLTALRTALGTCDADAADTTVCWLRQNCEQWFYVDNDQMLTYKVTGTEEHCPEEAQGSLKYREVGSGTCTTQDNADAYTALRDGFLGGRSACESTCSNWDKCTGYSWGENGLGDVPKWPWPKCYLHYLDKEAGESLPPAPPNPYLATHTSSDGAPGGMRGDVIESFVYTGSTEEEQDLDCSNKCHALDECTFWQRAVGSGDGRITQDCVQANGGDGNRCDSRPTHDDTHVIGGAYTKKDTKQECTAACTSTAQCVAGFFTFEEVLKDRPVQVHSSSSIAKVCDYTNGGLAGFFDKAAAKTNVCQPCTEHMTVSELVALGGAVQAEYSFVSNPSPPWVHTDGQNCGEGGSCSKTESELKIGNPTIATDVNAHHSADGYTVDQCKSRCDMSADCIGFSYDKGNSRCLYRVSTSCNSASDSNFACYTKNNDGNQDVAGVAKDLANCEDANTEWKYSGSAQSCDQQCQNLGMSCDNVAMNQQLDLAGFQAILNSLSGTPISTANAVVEDCNTGLSGLANTEAKPFYVTSSQVPKWCNSDFSKVANQNCGSGISDAQANIPTGCDFTYNSGASVYKQSSNPQTKRCDTSGVNLISTTVVADQAACALSCDNNAECTVWEHQPSDPDSDGNVPTTVKCALFKACGQSVADVTAGEYPSFERCIPYDSSSCPDKTDADRLDIGRDSSYYATYCDSSSADYSACDEATIVAACEKTCRERVSCAGFNYDRSNQRCYFRKSVTCVTNSDSNRDCYSKDTAAPSMNSCSLTTPAGTNRICACKGGVDVCKARNTALQTKLGGCTQSYANDPDCSDGSTAAPWCPAANELDTGWHQIDMGQQLSITGVRLHRGTDLKYAKSVLVKTSTDGSTFTDRTTCAGINSFTASVDCKFGLHKARYVRFYPQTYERWPKMKAEVFMSEDGWIEADGSNNACSGSALVETTTKTVNRNNPEQCIDQCKDKAGVTSLAVGDDGGCLCCSELNLVRAATKAYIPGPDGHCYLLNKKAGTPRAWAAGAIGFSKSDESLCWLKKNFQNFNDPNLASTHYSHTLRGGFRYMDWLREGYGCDGSHRPCVIARAQPLADFKCYAQYSWQWCDGSKDPLSPRTVDCEEHGDVTNAVCEYAECPAGSKATTQGQCPKSDLVQWTALRNVANPVFVGNAATKDECKALCKAAIAANPGKKACSWACNAACNLGDSLTTVDAAAHKTCYQYGIDDAEAEPLCEYPGTQDSTKYPADCPCVEDALTACNFACCPANYFTSAAATCQGDDCNFPSFANAHKWPEGCPCATRKWYYNMQTFTIDLDTLANWAGFDVKIKISDDTSGGFLAVDNIKFKGAPYSCVDFDGDWVAYTENQLQFPADGLGTGQGWSRSPVPADASSADSTLAATYAYIPYTKSACEAVNFYGKGTTGTCEYRACPAGAITSRPGLCRGPHTTCGTYPSGDGADTHSIHPSACPCVKLP